jgi:hypothetical protein
MYNQKIKKITTESNPFEKIINLHGNDNIDMDSTKVESLVVAIGCIVDNGCLIYSLKITYHPGMLSIGCSKCRW